MTSSIAFDIIARDKASTTFSRIGRASDSATKRLVSFGRSTAALAGFTGLTTAAAGFIKVGADYSTSLNKIQALSGLTDKQLGRVGSTLEAQSGQFAKMGQTTGDAAAGMVELVKAGLTANNALQAVTQTMVLAKAGELDVADASSLVANTLNTFGLKASQAGAIANYLANAANISSADVADLAESMKYVAPVAAATGVSLKQTSAILAELSNSGIAASNAGTGFRKFLLSLQAPSGAAKKDLHALGVEIFDASGKMKPLGTVVDILGTKLNKLTDQKRQKVLKDVFGLQGISSATVILKNGSKGLESYERGVSKAGAAARLANAGSKGFAGTLRSLRAETISTAQAEYRQLEPSLNNAAKGLQKFIEQMRTGKGSGGEFVHVLGDAVTVAKDVLKVFNSLPGSVKKTGVEFGVALIAVRYLTGGVASMGTTATATSARLLQLRAEMTYTATRSQALGLAMGKAMAATKMLAGAGGILLLSKAQHEANDSSRLLMNTLGGAAVGFAVGGPVGLAVGGLAGSFLTLFHHTKAAADAAKVSTPQWQSYADTLNGVAAATTAATRARIIDNLATKENRALVGKLGLDQRVIVNAMLGQPKALALVNKRQQEQLALADAAVKKQKEYIASHHDLNQLSAQRLTDLKTAQRLTENQIKAQDLLISGVANDAKEQRRKNSLLLTQAQLIKLGVPKDAAKFIDQRGIKQDIAAVANLIDKFQIVKGTQWTAVLRAAGIPPTKAALSQVQTALNAIKQGAVARVGVTDQASKTLHSITAILDSLAGKTFMFGIKPRAVPPSHPAASSPATHSRTPRASTSFSVTPGFGGDSSAAGGLLPRQAAKTGQATGSAYVSGLIKGISGHQTQVKTAMERLKTIMSKVSDSIASLKSLRSDFVSTFTADSIFGADLQTSGSLAGLMQFQSDQAAKAQQLLTDVQRVQQLGLSGSLLKQLQSAGSAGADQLHILAGASVDQIAQLNAMNAATTSALSAAGISVGNGIRGGNIDSSIAQAERQAHILSAMLRELQKMNGDTVVTIGPDAIIRVIKKYAKSQGKTVDQLLNG